VTESVIVSRAALSVAQNHLAEAISDSETAGDELYAVVDREHRIARDDSAQIGVRRERLREIRLASKAVRMHRNVVDDQKREQLSPRGTVEARARLHATLGEYPAGDVPAAGSQQRQHRGSVDVGEAWCGDGFGPAPAAATRGRNQSGM
jgi:hypothetical protein